MTKVTNEELAKRVNGYLARAEKGNVLKYPLGEKGL